MKSAQFIAVLLMLTPCLNATAADPAARVKTSLATTGDLWIGQRVIVVVELAAPGIFSNAPAFDLPDIPGVVLFAPEGSPVIGTETEGDLSYTTQRHELSVYSQRAGEIEIPSFSIRFESSMGFGKPTVEQQVLAPKMMLSVKRPPGTEQLKSVITTDRFSVREKWHPELTRKDFKPGDAFTRTVEIEAHDVPGMLLPQLPGHDFDGLKAYRKPPVVDDRSKRGDLTGRRIETVTYVCEQPGNDTLPSIAFVWWDPASQKLNRVELPAHAIEISQPKSADTGQTHAQTHRRAWLLPLVLVFGVTASIAIWIDRVRRTQLAGRSESAEINAFRAFQQACQSSDGSAVYRSLFGWLNQFLTDPETCSLDNFLQQAGDHKLTSELKSLEEQVYGQGSVSRATWDGRDVLRRVTSARSRLQQVNTHGEHSTGLPPLNPAS